jgi:hypothetical protein
MQTWVWASALMAGLLYASPTEAGFDNRGGADSPVPWGEDIPASIEDPLCIQALSAPDLSICAAVAATGGLAAVNAKLATVSCYLDAINTWQTAQMQCLQNQVTARAEKIIWPVKDVLRQVHMTFRSVDILRDEVARLACQWHLSPRVSIFRDMYTALSPFQWCRDAYVSVLGDGRNLRNAGLHEMAAWMGTKTQNLIGSRVAGNDDQSPESTWMYTATSIAGGHVDTFNSPAEAIRFSATTDADRLRARNSTLQMQAQRMLLLETLRSYRRQKDSDEDAWAMFMEAASEAAFRTAQGPPSVFTSRK